jgi:beta-N-acetylhexosaminidase
MTSRLSVPGVLLLGALSFQACFSAGGGGGPEGPVPPGIGPEADPSVPSATPDTVAEALPDSAEALPPAPPPAPVFDSWADSVLYYLSLEEKAAQLMMPWVLGDYAPVGSESERRILEMVEEQGVGGVILSVGSPTEVAAKINELQRSAEVPLLVAADLERGAGYRFKGAVYLPGIIALGGATEFPSFMAVGATGDTALAREMGRITGVEARALGIHTPFGGWRDRHRETLPGARGHGDGFPCGFADHPSRSGAAGGGRAQTLP